MVLLTACHSLSVSVQVKTLEQFSLDICHHFLTSFNHVLKAKVHMEEAPWRRLEKVKYRMANILLVTPGKSTRGTSDTKESFKSLVCLQERELTSSATPLLFLLPHVKSSALNGQIAEKTYTIKHYMKCPLFKLFK